MGCEGEEAGAVEEGRKDEERDGGGGVRGGGEEGGASPCLPKPQATQQDIKAVCARREARCRVGRVHSITLWEEALEEVRSRGLHACMRMHAGVT